MYCSKKLWVVSRQPSQRQTTKFPVGSAIGTQLSVSSVSNWFLFKVVTFFLIVNFRGHDVNTNETSTLGQLPPLTKPLLSVYTPSDGRNFRYLGRQRGPKPKSTTLNRMLPSVLASSELNVISNLWNGAEKPVKNSSLRRKIRQIVPLPRSTPTPPVSTEASSDAAAEAERMTVLYKEFLVDYAFFREWTRAQVILPQDNFSFCYYFTVELLLSKATLTINCSNGDVMRVGHKEPVIIMDFLVTQNQTFSGLYQDLLKKYSKRRPVLILVGRESFVEILDRVQPQQLSRNYKWTLVKHTQLTANGPRQLEIFDVFGFATSLTPLPQQIGIWSESDGLDIDAANATGVISFEGKKLRVTTVSGPPVVNLLPTADLLSATGFLPDILDSLSVLLNFKFILLTPADGKFGDVNQSGNWSGMVGMLQRNEADIALMSFSFTKSRQSAMDFSPPVEYSSTRLLIRRDWQIAELKWDAFFRPFEWKVWAAIPVLIGLGAMTLIIFACFRVIETSPGENVWLLSTCFLLQGQSEHSSIRVTPFRIASGTFWILAVFIFACYTARLTSFLAADTDKLPVKDLYEAVKSRAWKVGLVRGSSFLEKVKDSKAEEMSLLWKRLQEDSSVLVGGFQEGINKVYKERYIFFTSELIPTFLVKGNCSYTWLPDKYFPGFGYMGYQKGLPYSSSVSRMVAKLRENGQMRRLIKKWWGTASTCGRTGSEAFMAISLHETGSAFLILVIGASISVSFVLIEFIASAKKDNWQTNPANNANQLISPNEFGAPIVHGTLSNFLPHFAETEDRPLIWSIEDKKRGHSHSAIHSAYGPHMSIGGYKDNNFRNNTS